MSTPVKIKDTLLGTVISHVPECPEDTIIVNIRKAAIELCEKSFIWTETVEDVEYDTTEGVYTFSTPNGAQLMQVNHASYQGKPLPCDTEKGWDKRNAGWQMRTPGGSPVGFLMVGRYSMATIPPPADPASLDPIDVLATFRPTRDTTVLPDFLVEEWDDALLYGTLYRLYRMPDNDWTSKENSRDMRKDFKRECSRAKSEHWRGSSPASMTVHPRKFGQ